MTIDLVVFNKKLKCKIVNGRRTTLDTGRRTIAAGHLNDSGDLKKKEQGQGRSRELLFLTMSILSKTFKMHVQAHWFQKIFRTD